MHDSNAHSALVGLTQYTGTYAMLGVTNSVSFVPSKPQIPFWGCVAPGWKIVQPLLATVEKDEGYYTISDDEFSVYGEGKTLEQAKQDFIVSLIDYYMLLTAKDDVLTQDTFRRLQSYLRPIHPQHTRVASC